MCVCSPLKEVGLDYCLNQIKRSLTSSALNDLTHNALICNFAAALALQNKNGGSEHAAWHMTHAEWHIAEKQ